LELQKHSEHAPIVTNGVKNAGPCLWLYSYEDWSAYEARIDGLAPDDLDVQDFVSLMVSGASECPIDGQGRILLPALLRKHAKLEREVMFAGVGTRIEIWDSALFEEGRTRTLRDFHRIAAVVAGLEK
jgi:MraZ protein